MNPLELRKIIQVGYRFVVPDGVAPILNAACLPMEQIDTRWFGTFAFWLPAPQPFKRCAGRTQVRDARPFELQALRDGAIIEHVQEFEFPFQPSEEKLRVGLMIVWEGLTLDSLGVLPNGAPVDKNTRPAIEFTDITKENRSCKQDIAL